MSPSENVAQLIGKCLLTFCRFWFLKPLNPLKVSADFFQWSKLAFLQLLCGYVRKCENFKVVMKRNFVQSFLLHWEDLFS